MLAKKIPGYKIFMDKELGRGSYGTVYVAEKQSTEEDCAVKIIKKSKITKSSYLERALFSQISIMSKVQSPNIVSFLGVLESGNNFYIIQELCESDLERQLKIKKKYNEKQAKKILFQICNAFLQLIKQGIVHRDLKPSNLLVKKGKVKLCDFGFAKDNLHKNMKNQSNVGTPLYKPIQIFKGIPYTSKCDIWSLGIIFYELLHGKTPFDVAAIRTKEDLVRQIQKSNFTFDKSFDPLTIDFLQKTLQVYERDRIGWDQVYQHKIFDGKFNKYLDQNNKLKNKYEALLKSIVLMTEVEEINIRQLWESLGFTLTQKLTYDEFNSFIEQIFPGLQKQELVFIIEKIDKNGNGMISLKQLEQSLKSAEIIKDQPLKDIMINSGK